MWCLGAIKKDGRLAFARMADDAVDSGEHFAAYVCPVPHLGAWPDEGRAADIGASLDPGIIGDLDGPGDVSAGLDLAAYPGPEDRPEVLGDPRQCIPGVRAPGEKFAVLPPARPKSALGEKAVSS